MLNLEQISTLINGLKSWVLNEIKKSKADLGPLADEFVSFKEQVQDTIDNAALKPMVVMSKDGTLEANYNSSEIYNYVTSGGTAVFKYESEILPLIDFDETFSTFLFTINNGNFISTRAFIVYKDGRIETEDEFSNTVRIVNLSGDGTIPSLGPADIIDIANSGRLVLLEYNGDYYNLAEKSSEGNPYPMVTFQKWLYYESELRIVSIDINYNYEVNINFHDPLNIGVSSVNGQSGYVELTAEDVGALTEEDLSEMGFLTSEDAVTDSLVPFDADTLNGHDSEYFSSKEYVDGKYQNTILAPATAEVGQTIRVSEVDENGKPTTWEAVDTTRLRVIAEVILSEETNMIEISMDTEGNPLALEEMLISMQLFGGSNNLDRTSSVLYFNGRNTAIGRCNLGTVVGAAGKSLLNTQYFRKLIPGLHHIGQYDYGTYPSNKPTAINTYGIIEVAEQNNNLLHPKFTQLNIYIPTEGYTYGIGSKIQIFGR